MNEKYYLTTTLPYVNSEPHIGFALEMVHADIHARFQRLFGKEVIFNTGTDEHGLKIQRKAEEAGVPTQAYVDEYAAKFEHLKNALSLTYTNFIRTTNPSHKAAAQEFWRRCMANGDIYKKTYQVKYCVGCELEKTESELVNGRCSTHPHLELELIDEENYFFKFSRYEKPLLEYYHAYKDFVVPKFRFHEIIAFVEHGLQDFSVSRLKSKMSWGVPVPDDQSQVMYVWFDALINYISTLGWPEKTDVFEEFWGTKEQPKAVQFAGKDNLRQQSAMWQAMLMSAGLPNSRHIVIHGFIGSGGQKMSKSLGNVVDPYRLVEKYGTDAVRFWLAYEMSTFEDGDFTIEAFEQTYNAKLASGLGNLVSRVLRMAESVAVTGERGEGKVDFDSEFVSFLEKFEVQKAIQWLWGKYSELDQYIALYEPYKVIKVDVEAGRKHIEFLLQELKSLNTYLSVFLPVTAEKVLSALDSGELNTPLFPRLQVK